MTHRDNFVWILLAAGTSTRLGQAKQLLQLGRQPLVAHQVNTLLATQLPVCVISGAVDLRDHLPKHNNLSILYNPNWQQGMGTSVSLAQAHFPNTHLGWVLVDQYALTSRSILAFYHHWSQHNVPILVSQYSKKNANAWGVPVIIDREVLTQAQIYNPEHGLKPWLLTHPIELAYFYWPEARQDIDTPSQWQQLQQQKSWHHHLTH